MTLCPGEIVGISGKSGCGKSTLGRLIASYLRPENGVISVDGLEPGVGRSSVQYVHQSPAFAVDPRWRIGRIVEEAWCADSETANALGVQREWYDRYPHELSGGELQRVVLLRALAPTTSYLVADELTAMLDPITQARTWHVLLDRCRNGLGVIAISHDAALLKRIATRCYELTQGHLVRRKGILNSYGASPFAGGENSRSSNATVEDNLQ